MASIYERALEAERAKHPEIEGNWPEALELNGKVFGVDYTLDLDTLEIEGFSLSYDGEEFFPVDVSVIYLIEEHIWEIISWEYGDSYSFRIHTEKERELYEEIRAVHERLKELKADG